MSHPGHPTTRAVAEAIESLRNALFRDYGVDYSFHVLGRGHLLGASSKALVVEAVIAAQEGK